MNVEIVALVVSSVHPYEGRPAGGPQPDPEPVEREVSQVEAGLGIVGDRYFNQSVHRNAAVTVFDAGALDQLAVDRGLGTVPDPVLTRRNIILRGYSIDRLASRRPPWKGSTAISEVAPDTLKEIEQTICDCRYSNIYSIYDRASA